MTSEKRYDFGQDQFPGMESDLHADRRDMDETTSFVRAATPEFAGLRPANYWDIKPGMVELVGAEHLEDSLFDRSHPVRLAPQDPGRAYGVTYTPDQERSKVTVFLTAREFHLVPRSVSGIARAATSNALARLPRLPASDTDLTKATLSSAGTLETISGDLETYLGTLGSDIDRLQGLLVAAGSKRAHWAIKQEADMRIETTWFREHVLGDILEATSHHRAWSAQQHDLAKRSMEKRLFFEREGNKHLGYWRDMLRLALTYTGHKDALFKDRLSHSGQVASDARQSVQT